MKRVVIVANGVIANPGAEFERWVDGETVLVAADGGTHHLLGCGTMPHHVIGDMDSLTPRVRAKLHENNVKLHPHPPQKDETDLELALLWTAKAHAEAELVILGAMGGRPDQALANFLLLSLPGLTGRDVVIAEGPWRVRVVRGGETQKFAGSVGDTLSLVPLGGDAAGVTTSGLMYPLKGETLRFGLARGVSNVFVENKVTVKVGTGYLWVFHEVVRDT